MVIDVIFMVIVFICLIKDDEILIGLVKILEYFLVGWFNLVGECK